MDILIKKFLLVTISVIILVIIINFTCSVKSSAKKNRKKKKINKIEMYENFDNYLLNGSEDHCLGKLGNNIIIATGFCDGNVNFLIKNSYFNKTISSFKRGFIKNIYSYNIKNDKINIIGELPNEFIPRQESGSIVINDKYYLFGGYSYKELSIKELEYYKKNNIKLPPKSKIFTYIDSIVINYKNNILNIKKSINLPYPICGFKIVKYKNKIYFFGGATYTGKSFNTFTIINKIKIGCGFFSIKLDKEGNLIKNSLELINNFKGTDRMEPNVHIYGDNLYVIGGIKTNDDYNNDKGYIEYNYYNVMDNWKYNFKSKKWINISSKDFPLINQGSVLYKNYIILIGGTSKNKSYFNNKLNNNFNKFPNLKYRITDLKIDTNIKNIKKEYYFSNLIMIYDIDKDKYYLSDYKLPLNINLPSIIIINEYIYLLGGEANPNLINNVYFGNCSSFTMKINVKDILK
jgi:N-acetylneuraminic acid mutarotase